MNLNYVFDLIKSYASKKSIIEIFSFFFWFYIFKVCCICFFSNSTNLNPSFVSLLIFVSVADNFEF